MEVPEDRPAGEMMCNSVATLTKRYPGSVKALGYRSVTVAALLQHSNFSTVAVPYGLNTYFEREVLLEGVSFRHSRSSLHQTLSNVPISHHMRYKFVPPALQKYFHRTSNAPNLTLHRPSDLPGPHGDQSCAIPSETD
jgi:hypothetical protein